MYSIIGRNSFDTLQETSERHSPNDEYETFVTAHIEAATKCISTKPKAKCSVLCEGTAVKKKRVKVKKKSILNKRNPTNANA